MNFRGTALCIASINAQAHGYQILVPTERLHPLSLWKPQKEVARICATRNVRATASPASRPHMLAATGASPPLALSMQSSKRKPTGTQQLSDRRKRCAKEAPQPACKNPFAIASRAGANATSELPVDESDDDDDVESQILAAQQAARAQRDKEAAVQPEAAHPPPHSAVGSESSGVSAPQAEEAAEAAAGDMEVEEEGEEDEEDEAAAIRAAQEAVRGGGTTLGASGAKAGGGAAAPAAGSAFSLLMKRAPAAARSEKPEKPATPAKPDGPAKKPAKKTGKPAPSKATAVAAEPFRGRPCDGDGHKNLQKQTKNKIVKCLMHPPIMA